jgi:hypothetical protein
VPKLTGFLCGHGTLTQGMRTRLPAHAHRVLRTRHRSINMYTRFHKSHPQSQSGCCSTVPVTHNSHHPGTTTTLSRCRDSPTSALLPVVCVTSPTKHHEPWGEAVAKRCAGRRLLRRGQLCRFVMFKVVAVCFSSMQMEPQSQNTSYIWGVQSAVVL